MRIRNAIILIIFLAGIAGTLYFLRGKIKELTTPQSSVVVVDTAAAVAASPAGSVVPPSPTPAPLTMASPPPLYAEGPCEEISQYKENRSELGLTVNLRELRETKTAKWIQKIEEFRNEKGLPLPLAVNQVVLDREGVVYQRCKNVCRGAGHLVFLKQLHENKEATVLTKAGKLTKIPLLHSGIEVATIDELDSDGVPFRSWYGPFYSGDLYVKDLDLFFKLDIEGAWLKIPIKGSWKVVGEPKGIQKLQKVESVKVDGCNPEEQCLTTFDDKKARHFKAPKTCPDLS